MEAQLAEATASKTQADVRCSDAEQRLAALARQIGEIDHRRDAFQVERDDLVRAEVAAGRTRTAAAVDASVYRANAGFIVAKGPPSARAAAMDPAARTARLTEVGDMMAALDARRTRLMEQRDPLIRELAGRCGKTLEAVADVAGMTKQNVSLILRQQGRARRRAGRRAEPSVPAKIPKPAH